MFYNETRKRFLQQKSLERFTFSVKVYIFQIFVNLWINPFYIFCPKYLNSSVIVSIYFMLIHSPTHKS